MKKKHCSVIAIGAIASCLASVNVAASTIEVAVDTTGLAGVIPIAYGSHTTNSGIGVGADVDGYTFQGSSGDQIRVVMSGQTRRLDPQIELRDPTGAVLQTLSCNSGSLTCSANFDQGLSIDGTYQLNLSDAGSDEAGNYTLHLEQLRPSINSVRLDYDNNDTLIDELGHAGDNEILTFQGASGTGIRLTFEGVTRRLDPHLQIWDPLGVLVGEARCNSGSLTCSAGVDLNLTESGLYTAALFDTGFDETGNYNATLACTFGACPVVPLPAGLPLLGSALSLLFGGRALRRIRGKG